MIARKVPSVGFVRCSTSFRFEILLRHQTVQMERASENPRRACPEGALKFGHFPNLEPPGSHLVPDRYRLVLGIQSVNPLETAGIPGSGTIGFLVRHLFSSSQSDLKPEMSKTEY